MAKRQKDKTLKLFKNPTLNDTANHVAILLARHSIRILGPMVIEKLGPNFVKELLGIAGNVKSLTGAFLIKDIHKEPEIINLTQGKDGSYSVKR